MELFSNGRHLKESWALDTHQVICYPHNWTHHIAICLCCLRKALNFCQPPLINLATSPVVGWVNSQILNSGITHRVALAFPKHSQSQLKSCVWFGFPQMVLLLTLIKHRKNKTAI